MAAISDFRKKKLLYVFHVFFDINQSGEIDRKDFELAINKICNLRGWPEGHAKNKETHDAMFRIWDGLRTKADEDNDGQVSVDEWCNMWEAYAKNSNAVLDWQVRYMNFMFDLEDASNDGTIDSEEFSSVYSSYGVDKKECLEAFKKMSKGAGEVNREQFAVLWREYFSSDDATAPGNFIFGKIAF